MGEQYCLKCGPVKSTHAANMRDNACDECSRIVIGSVPTHVRDLQARISELEAIIEAVPHDYFCYAGDPWATGEYMENAPCTCWKSKIGESNEVTIHNRNNGEDSGRRN